MRDHVLVGTESDRCSYSRADLKSRVEDLAIFGGEPAFAEPLHVGCPNIGDSDRMLERMRTILRTRRLTNNGPFVQEFERRIADFVGVSNCIAVCNATVGLQLAIRGLGLSGEVLVPAFTFVATPHALEFQGIRPVFCDVNGNHNTDPADLERRITGRTTGILGVHLWGRAADVETLTHIARKHGLKLLFDASHAFGCSHKGRMIGCFGDAEVFSFHGTKFINAFEGGAIVTNDNVLAERLRLMRNFGFADYDEVIYLGSNAKMCEASAAMGLTSLESIEEFVAVNARNYREYQVSLAGIPGITLCAYEDAENNNYQYIVVQIDSGALGLTRDQLKDVLWAENVFVRRYFYPGCHRMEPYRSDARSARSKLPQTERLASEVLVLPTGTAIDSSRIERIVHLIRFVAENSALVRQSLSVRTLSAVAS